MSNLELVAGDVELAVFQWAKGDARINAVVNGQIGFQLPNSTPPLPYLAIEMVSETAQNVDGLILDTRLQFSCWAKSFDKATASALARAVQTSAHKMIPTDFVVPQGVVTLHGAAVDQVLWLPEAGVANTRYTVDVIVTSTTSTPQE